MAISTRMSRNPVTPSAQSPSIGARPSSSRPSSVKNSMAASMSSTTMPTLSIRLTVMTSALRRLSRMGLLLRCIRDGDRDVNPYFSRGKKDPDCHEQAKEDKEAANGYKPGPHRTLEMRDEDGHPVTVIGNIMLCIRHSTRIGAEGCQQDCPRQEAGKRACDEKDKQNLP